MTAKFEMTGPDAGLLCPLLSGQRPDTDHSPPLHSAMILLERVEFLPQINPVLEKLFANLREVIL